MTCVLNPPCLACLTDTNTLLTAELARQTAENADLRAAIHSHFVNFHCERDGLNDQGGGPL